MGYNKVVLEIRINKTTTSAREPNKMHRLNRKGRKWRKAIKAQQACRANLLFVLWQFHSGMGKISSLNGARRQRRRFRLASRLDWIAGVQAFTFVGKSVTWILYLVILYRRISFGNRGDSRGLENQLSTPPKSVPKNTCLSHENRPEKTARRGVYRVRLLAARY